MKNIKMIKSLGFAFAAMATLGCFLFFTSASTVKHSNSEAIADLSNQLEQMTAELDGLRNAGCEDDIWSEPTIGQVAMFAGNFAPRGWAFCDGQLLPVSQNTALFSILGTIYGGDGRTTFGLPDLRGRVAVHAGNGPGLSPVRLGQRFGHEQVFITPQTVSVASSSGRDGQMAVSSILPEYNVMQPSLAVNYIIALQGVFPSRN